MATVSRVHDRRRCERCGSHLPDGSSVNRRFCPPCGHERRALTFLAQADRELEHATRIVAIGAREKVNAAMGDLEAPAT